ncbi:lysosomal proton-coupled steroid conjugate and bile acid symporter SLC46A3-like [Physella acuta]|uniref:lysosomal proton-coupled steroid conjugate and bile acid symporter SLC46A3-like n=1 Tax=Physella acuta TaxID=109671 RepID=UPI0027DE6D72|nr:lysosomal proton-coupled steroid conjugate and bile acid symporter SLC46A3-like [Physella acuta]
MARHIFVGSRSRRFDLANITVEPVIFLYMFTNFLYFPTLQFLILHKVCLSEFSNEFCEAMEQNETFKHHHLKELHNISAETSFWILKTNIAVTVPSFFVVILFLGSLGDKIGRKVPVILPCLGAFVAYLSALLNARFMSASLGYILIGPVINGLTGGYIACLMSVFSYVGHISTPTSKITRVGIVQSMVYLSGTVGIFVSGIMIEQLGYVWTFFCACLIILLAVIYSVAWLENVGPSSSEASQGEGCCKMMFNFVIQSFHCVLQRRERKVFPALLLLIVAIDVLMLCTSGDMDINLLYLKDNLDFSPQLFGYLRGLDNFLRGLILLTFLPLVRKLTSMRELPLVMFGLVSYTIDFILVGAASTKWMVFLAAGVGMFKGIPSAGIRSTASTLVPANEQGRLFGVIAASESVISLVASLLFNQLYPATQAIYPGLCYMLGAALLLLIAALVCFVHMALVKPEVLPPYQVIEEEPHPDDAQQATIN